MDSQNERAHMSILTSVVSLIQSLPPPAPFKPWDMKIVLTLNKNALTRLKLQLTKTSIEKALKFFINNFLLLEDFY